MRLFVAVDDATREAAIRLRQRVARRASAADRDLRWVHPDLLHLTVRFLGEREDVDDIERVLAAPLGLPSFELRWGRPGWLPPRGRPRVFHVPLTAGAEALAGVAAAVNARLATLGLPAEARAFTAHLTLARVRDGAAPTLAREVEEAIGQESFAPSLVVPVTGVELYESRLSPGGPTYRARLRSPLS